MNRPDHAPAGAERTPGDDVSASRTAGSGPTLTVVIAIVVNLAVAVAKMAVGALTRSSSIISEGWHATADTANEIVLLVAQRRAARAPDQRHPLGHGREAYFWALIAAVGVFVAGGLLSIHQGIQELTHPTAASKFGAAYTVLLIALALEAFSLSRAWRQLHLESREHHRGLLEQVQLSSEPTTRAVFGEDVAAVIGNLVALVGVALHQITESVIPDAIASLIIGVLLGLVGLALAERNRDFLIGEAPPSQVQAAVQKTIRSQAGIGEVHEVIVVFSGPVAASVIAHVGVDAALDGREVEELMDRTSAAVRAAVPIISRAEIVPTTGHRAERTAEGCSTPQGTHTANGIHRLSPPVRTES